ncbi:MAG: glycosyltransferase [Alphaproteobacteria bacterium]|nr:glycosyltransferase [Alphaproteobacteria bacterium]
MKANTDTIKISVIVPIYNVEKYIRRCLDSIINQTFHELEIICVNDGSTDKSEEILIEYKKKDSRIKIINQENSGLSAARNSGLKIAQGEYVGFVDSDDWIDLDFFEKLYSAAKTCDADAACAEIKRTHASGKIITKLKFEKLQVLTSVYEKYSYNKIPKMCYVWNKIYKKSELDRQNLSFKEGVMFEDIYFTPKFLYFSKKIVIVPDVYYNYWANNKSISRDMRDKNQIDLISARKSLIKFSREHHIIFDEKFYIKNKTTYKIFGITILRIHEWETIRKYYLFGLVPFFEKRISL